MTKEELKKENEVKKEYLRSYLKLIKRAEILQVGIEELRHAKMNPSVTYSDMPRRSGHTDLSSYAAQLDKKERYVADIEKLCLERYDELCEKIDSMTDDIERTLLQLKYISGYTFDDIAERLGYSRRSITRVHDKALSNFKM